MSYQPLWLRDLVAYSLQAAALVGVGAILERVLQLRVPRVRLAYWQALLAVCVFLPLLQPWRPEVLETSGAALSSVTLTTAMVSAPSGPSLAEIVLWVICAGILLRALWMAMGLSRLWLYRRRAQRIERVPAAIEEAQRLAPVSSGFFISCQLRTPATFGFFRPAILFPTRFFDMGPSTQRAIALHELLHVERRDWLWNMFEEVVLTLLWFHLPLWWVVRSARLSREQVVDAEAVRRTKARTPYLKALLEMAGQQHLAESLPAPLFLREHQLAERVALMMKEAHMSRKQLTISILTAAGTLMIAGAGVVRAFPLKTSTLPNDLQAVSSAASQLPTSGASKESASANDQSGQNKAKPGEPADTFESVKMIYHPVPPYTSRARKAHLSGTVVLSIVIDAAGNVSTVKEISKPLGEGLDESAINTVRTWKFKPAVRNGVPVPITTNIEFSFRVYEKAGKVRGKTASGSDPSAQTEQSQSGAAKGDTLPVEINQADLQKEIERAMEQARIAQQSVPEIDTAKIRQQIDEAMKQAKIAQQVFPKVDQAKIQQQVEEAMKRLQKLNTPEMQQRMQERMKGLGKMDSPEMRQKAQDALKQLEKMNTPEMRRRLDQAMKQAQIAQAEAAKMNQAEIQRQLKQTQDELRATRKQLEAARKQLAKQRLELEKQHKQIKPTLPSPSPKAAPVPAPSSTPLQNQ